MANSILQDRHGPDWPLGFIKVVTPGTPVGIMSVVDPSGTNDPRTVSSTTAPGQEFTVRCQQIIFQGFHPGAEPPGAVVNTGLAYIVRTNAANSGGTGNKADTGVIVHILQPGETFVLATGATVEDAFGPYRYSIDADNANDGAFVTLLIF